MPCTLSVTYGDHVSLATISSREHNLHINGGSQRIFFTPSLYPDSKQVQLSHAYTSLPSKYRRSRHQLRLHPIFHSQPTPNIFSHPTTKGSPTKNGEISMPVTLQHCTSPTTTRQPSPLMTTSADASQ